MNGTRIWGMLFALSVNIFKHSKIEKLKMNYLEIFHFCFDELFTESKCEGNVLFKYSSLYNYCTIEQGKIYLQSSVGGKVHKK